MVPHSIWDTLISHVRSVEVPENVNARDAVTPEAGPTLRYTKGEEDIRNLTLVKNVLKCILLSSNFYPHDDMRVKKLLRYMYVCMYVCMYTSWHHIKFLVKYVYI